MSEARFDTNLAESGHVQRAIDHLNAAQEIVDTLDRPHLGARLQEVIDALQEAQGGD
jgi:hypothetical protein